MAERKSIMISQMKFLKRHAAINAGTAITIVICLTILTFAARISAQTTPEYGIRDKTPNRVLLINARLMVSPGIQIDSASLLIIDDRIAGVGRDIKDTSGVTVVDMRGRTVYPGFIDAFTNYGLTPPGKKRSRDRGPRYTRDRVGGSAWNEAIKAERNWVDEFRPDPAEAKKLREQGFTVVLSVQQDGILRGRSFVATLGDGLPNDLILRPHHWHVASFDKGTSQQEYPGSLMGVIALLRQTFLDADWYGTAHDAYLHNPDQPTPEYNSSLEALGEADNEIMIFESKDELSLIRADRLADEFGIPVIHAGSGREYIALKQIKATGAPIILPVNYPRKPEIKTLADEHDLSLAELRHWEWAPSNASLLNKAGISFALGTHKLKKKSTFLKNVRLAVRRGLPKDKALAALTTIPADICGISEKAGTLEKGKLANLVICDGDLFEDEAIIHSVWIQGKEFEFTPIPPVDMRGDYEFSLNDLTIKMSITGRETKLKGEFTAGEKKGKLTHIEFDENKLDFSIQLDTLGFDGLIRFSGRFDKGVINGWMSLADGTRASWTATRVSEFVPKPDEDDDEDESEELVSKLTFPNKAYGRTTPPEQVDLLIKNGTIWTSDEAGVLENADMLIRDGLIAEIGSDLSAPKGVQVIDAEGKYVTPGIIDSHSHIAVSGDVNEGTEAVTSEVRISDVVNPYDIAIYQQLAGGLTASHLLHGSANPIGGQLQLIKLRWGETDEGLKFDESPHHIKFALGENVKQSNWGERYNKRYPQTRLGAEAIIRDAFQAAREYEDSWNRYNALSKKERARTIPPRRNLRLEALVDVLHSRIPVACHAYVQSEMLMLMSLAQEYGFQVRSFEHGLEAYKIGPEIAENGVAVCTFPDWWAYKFEVYEAIAYGASLLNEAGVLTVIKSDSREMARRLPQEAGKSIRYGNMDPVDALKMVTINPARVLSVDHRIGSLRKGKDADFVIWDGPPLSIYSKPLQTWIEGRRYFDLDEDKVLREQIREEKNRLIQKIVRVSGKDSKKHKDDTEERREKPSEPGSEVN